MLLRYLREGRAPYGVVVVADADVFGWSLCCPRDRFRRTLGRQIALQRAESGKYHINAIDTRIPPWQTRWQSVLAAAVDMRKRFAPDAVDGGIESVVGQM